MYLVSMFHSKIKNPYEKVKYIQPLSFAECSTVFLLGFIKSGIKTDVTNNYLFTTPEGLNTAVTGLYSLARELPGGADNNESNLYIVTMCDFNTDIAILRAGVSTSIGRLNTSFTPSTGDVNKFWKHHYGIIGKANEIIVAARSLGLDDSDVLHAWSEAKFFRGRSYFELWKRFDRLYLNITPTTVDNLKREYKPASHEELMTLITTDLDDAMKGWTGRFLKIMEMYCMDG